MKLMLDIGIKPPVKRISYSDKIFIIGSCFSEHIGGKLQELKFATLQNPNGILFDPVSVSKSLNSYTQNKRYNQDDLFFRNELWQSWQHHSVFSGVKAEEVINVINQSQLAANSFLKNANWLFITLGSSFVYRLCDLGASVANCHRAPAGFFTKHLLTIEEIIKALNDALENVKNFNPSINIVFTISPVRHIRDGVIENNRSKARLIEAVHHLCNQYDNTCYFPAYELVIDVLRDHRFYDVDLVHPNYAATGYVFEKFAENYIDAPAQKLMTEIRDVATAARHKAFQPSTQAHKAFLNNYLLKVKELQARNSTIDLSSEEAYFAGTGVERGMED